ncbi:MAG: cytochrome c biogenesis CcdA family protein [Acidimicrobiales bacterium]
MGIAGVSVVAAFAGGVASFSSPCVLPLVPAYLSLVGGLDLARNDTQGAALAASAVPPPAGSVASAGVRLATGRRLGAITRDTALFVAGFGSVFVLLGLSASAVGRAVVHQQGLLTRISGVVVFAMALFLLGTLFLRSPGLYREWRLHPRLARLGPFAAPVAGAAFAFGWTPCVGPILASVLALSADQGHLGQAALLLSVYSLGLGTPFLLVAVFFDRVQGPLAWLRRHGTAVTAVSATVLGAMGVLLVLDRLAWVTTLVQRVS